MFSQIAERRIQNLIKSYFSAHPEVILEMHEALIIYVKTKILIRLASKLKNKIMALRYPSGMGMRFQSLSLKMMRVRY